MSIGYVWEGLRQVLHVRRCLARNPAKRPCGGFVYLGVL